MIYTHHCCHLHHCYCRPQPAYWCYICHRYTYSMHAHHSPIVITPQPAIHCGPSVRQTATINALAG